MHWIAALSLDLDLFGPSKFRLYGTIVRTNPDKSTLEVRAGGVEQRVVYNSVTEFATRGKPGGEADSFKEGAGVVVLGKYDKYGDLVAERIELGHSMKQ
jgi:hypothetical protein